MKTIYFDRNQNLDAQVKSNTELQTLTKDALFKGITHFAYIKKSDGSVRDAFGTLNGDLIPGEAGPGGNSNEEVQRYYDVEAKGWRTYTIENLIALL